MERLFIVPCNETNAIKCETVDYCVSAESLCDGYSCCPDESDEKLHTHGFKCALKGASSSKRSCSLPQHHLNDNITQCFEREDRCFKNVNGTEVLDNKKCFRCFDKKLVRIAISYHDCNVVIRIYF